MEGDGEKLPLMFVNVFVNLNKSALWGPASRLEGHRNPTKDSLGVS